MPMPQFDKARLLGAYCAYDVERWAGPLDAAHLRASDNRPDPTHRVGYACAVSRALLCHQRYSYSQPKFGPNDRLASCICGYRVFGSASMVVLHCANKLFHRGSVSVSRSFAKRANKRDFNLCHHLRCIRLPARNGNSNGLDPYPLKEKPRSRSERSRPQESPTVLAIRSSP
jgi:hypothetical protein